MYTHRIMSSFWMPSFCRLLTLRRDCVPDQKVHDILRSADIVSPWTVGRCSTPEQVARISQVVWKPDLDWCQNKGKDYLPVVFPGFSWHNLNGDRLNAIPRLKGQFLASQIAAAKRIGCNMLYVAMFDEVDEGTAIFKCTNDPPQGDGAKFIGYEGLPSDFYLKLVGGAFE